MGRISTVGQLAMLLGRAWMSHACGALAHLVTYSTVCAIRPLRGENKPELWYLAYLLLGENRVPVAGHAQRRGYQGDLFRMLFYRRLRSKVLFVRKV